MRRKSHATDLSSEEIVKDIRRATRKQYSAEKKIRIVLDGLRGEQLIAELCRREGIAESTGVASFATRWRSEIFIGSGAPAGGPRGLSPVGFDGGLSAAPTSRR